MLFLISSNIVFLEPLRMAEKLSDVSKQTGWILQPKELEVFFLSNINEDATSNLIIHRDFLVIVCKWLIWVRLCFFRLDFRAAVILNKSIQETRIESKSYLITCLTEMVI